MTAARALLAVDTLDDRREIFHLLHRLPPASRIAFVNRVCKSVVLKGSATHPGVGRSTFALAALAMRNDKANEALTTDLFFDLWHLAMQFENFNWDSVLTDLVQWARYRPTSPARHAASSSRHSA